MTPKLNFRISGRVIRRGYDRRTCWVQSRGGFIPRQGRAPTAIITMQKLLLSGCDVFGSLHVMRSDDDGHTWSGPTEQPGYGRFPAAEGLEGIVSDFMPSWHGVSGKLLVTGQFYYYRGDTLETTIQSQRPVYAVFNDSSGVFDPWQTLEFPHPSFNYGCGNAQRVDLVDGDILLPVFGGNLHQTQAGRNRDTRVLRCGFDGGNLKIKAIGPPVRIAQGSGTREPSLAFYDGKYYLSLRNDLCGHVAVSEDGLNFDRPRPWLFDDGWQIGNYNTQQRWAVHETGLYLVYTRRGLNNDHVFRHRAPLLIARVDPGKLRLIRETEQVVVPERGARLGNFSVARHSPGESWVVVTEWMQNSGDYARVALEKIRRSHQDGPWNPPHRHQACEAFGSDNATWVGKIIWH